MIIKPTSRIFSGASPEEIASDVKFLTEFKETGMKLEELADMIERKLVPHFIQYELPEFHSLYNFFPEEGAVLGANIALRYNQGVTNWLVSPGGVMLEELCCRALCELFGLGPESSATFMYCGTYANQQALYMALHKKAEDHGFDFAQKGLLGFPHPENLAVLTSEEAHFSLKHAVRFLGLGEKSLISIPSDRNRRIDMDALHHIVDSAGPEREIFCLVSTAATTSTGSIDPIAPLSEWSRQNQVWHHVDAAFGLSFKLLEECAPLFAGIEEADSITWDPHKNFGVPIPSSLLFVKDRKDFDRMAIYGKYFNRENDLEPNPGLKSPPSTRPLSALPLVTYIKHLGLDKVRERLRGPYSAIQKLAADLRREPDIEVCHTPDTSLLCIRVIPEGMEPCRLNDLQQFIYDTFKKRAERSIALTRLGDKTVLRLVAISPCVTYESLWESVREARDIAADFR